MALTGMWGPLKSVLTCQLQSHPQRGLWESSEELANGDISVLGVTAVQVPALDPTAVFSNASIKKLEGPPQLPQGGAPRTE